MAQLNVGQFTSWNLSEQELFSGSILNYLQKQVIQNDLARIAEQILTLRFDPNNQNQFVQDDAFLKGQLALLRHMLDRSAEAENLATKQSSGE